MIPKDAYVILQNQAAPDSFTIIYPTKVPLDAFRENVDSDFMFDYDDVMKYIKKHLVKEGVCYLIAKVKDVLYLDLKSKYGKDRGEE